MAFLQESALKEALKSFYMATEGRRHEQFVVPVTGCSVWDDFVAGSRTIGRRSWADSLLAGSNKLVLYLSWQSPVHIG